MGSQTLLNVWYQTILPTPLGSLGLHRLCGHRNHDLSKTTRKLAQEILLVFFIIKCGFFMCLCFYFGLIFMLKCCEHFPRNISLCSNKCIFWLLEPNALKSQTVA